MVYAAILAGGKGTRMGSDIPKQFLNVRGVPIIIHTLRRFVLSGMVDDTVVCVPGMYVTYTRDLIAQYSDISGAVSVIEGGIDRTGSLVNACSFFEQKRPASSDDVIITHDCVRPFINNEIIASGIAAARQFGGATAAIPAVDTICVSYDGKLIDSVPDRSTLYSVQTPQTFMMKEFCELLYSLTDEEKSVITDASAVLRLRGKTVSIALGSPSNIKITHPDDISVAENIMSNGEFNC